MITVREPARHLAFVLALWIVVLWIAVSLPRSVDPSASLTSQIFGAALLATAVSGLLWVTAHLLSSFVRINAQSIELHGLRRHERLRAPLAEIAAYRMTPSGNWFVVTAEGPVVVAVSEPWELHRAMLDLAPETIRKRRMRFHGPIPDEEFRGLWTFDVERFASRALPQLAGVLTAALILALFVHRRANWGALGQPLGIALVPLLEMWERIDVTHEGIVRRSPWLRRTILWADVRAIFREGSEEKRSFVVVGSEAAIHIPAHLAIHQDVMEKVCFSIPHTVVCVNFDATTFRGYRRRARAEKERSGELPFPVPTH